MSKELRTEVGEPVKLISSMMAVAKEVGCEVEEGEESGEGAVVDVIVGGMVSGEELEVDVTEIGIDGETEERDRGTVAR